MIITSNIWRIYLNDLTGIFNTKSFISSLKRRSFGCRDINGRMLKAYPLPFNTRCKQLHVAQASPFFNSNSSAFVWNLLFAVKSFYVAILCVDILYVKVEINNEASALLWGWWLVYDKIKYLTKLLRQRAAAKENKKICFFCIQTLLSESWVELS